MSLGEGVSIPSVAAHARLDHASPEPDSVVAEAPAEIRIWFTQELTLRGNELRVTDADGNQVDNLDAATDQTDPNRKQLVATIPVLGPGTYTVHYTSSSADDGHSYSDSYQFTVATVEVAQPETEAGAPVSDQDVEGAADATEAQAVGAGCKTLDS
jgi:methionine-rich copper-binding protein CopC